ncbi:unnamed protein product [Bursaphelenchus xylophilus]|uniref:(pine wood nematode) hypothetical protein n=1 Tax=Bursaphelenchus xylophilus TaxID=6326 RepID=A0A7I8WHR7_BURXY|nr:unnamed protein product [Bursaphelenchus xylophilus]CAG9109424.1 unnamed protein product [Bursaphelenchus xylophilus]
MNANNDGNGHPCFYLGLQKTNPRLQPENKKERKGPQRTSHGSVVFDLAGSFGGMVRQMSQMMSSARVFRKSRKSAL